MYNIVLCTTNSRENAEKIADILVSNRLAACVNIIDSIASLYRWQGKVVKDTEFLLLIKSKSELFEELKAKILENHSYEVPEVISLDIKDGTKAYLDWIGASVL